MTATTQAPLSTHPRPVPPADGTHSLAARRRHALHVRLDAGAGNDVALGHVQRPVWRGGVHVIGLVVAVPAVVALVLNSNGDVRTRLSVAVYATGICSMLAVSATYHRWIHGLRARCAWRRADHATIFAAIAGSSTPTVLAALPGTTGLVLVAATWSAGTLGAGCKLSRWHGGDRAGTAMYAVTIASSSIAIPWVWSREGTAAATLLTAGGVVYLVGVACFAKQRPKLRAAVFSYHEVWHLFTVVAAAVQFTAIWMMTS